MDPFTVSITIKYTFFYAFPYDLEEGTVQIWYCKIALQWASILGMLSSGWGLDWRDVSGKFGTAKLLSFG